MSKYTLTIEGDFKRYECNKCPLGIFSISGFVCVMDDGISCPLEEATVAKNATVEGEWKIIDFDKDKKTVVIECAECGAFFKVAMYEFGAGYNYCHVCGADMRGGKE